MKNSVFPIVLLIAFTFSTPCISFSQDTGEKEFNTQKTEFNIAVTNLFAKNNLWPYYYLDGGGDYIYSILDYYPRTKLLVGLKFHNPKGAVRLGTTFHFSSKKHENDDGSDVVQKYKELETGLYLGYEWHSTFNRVNIYYGLDVFSNYLKYQYTSENQYSNSEYNNSEFTVGINPLVGVNFFITPHLSVGTEVKFMLEYVSGKYKSETLQTGQQPNSSETKSSGFRTRFGPLGFLSINIHF